MKEKVYLLVNKFDETDIVLSPYKFYPNYNGLTLKKIMSEHMRFQEDENIKKMLSVNYHAHLKGGHLKIRLLNGQEFSNKENEKNMSHFVNKKFDSMCTRAEGPDRSETYTRTEKPIKMESKTNMVLPGPLGSCERSILINKYKKHIEKIQNKSDLKIIFNKKTSISELKEILKKYVPATHRETNAYVLMEAKLAGKSI